MELLSYLREHIVLLDGGTGTLLQKAGLRAGELPERWNITHPDVVAKIHLDYYNAGSHIVSANTFGANALHYDDAELEAVICAGLSLVQQAKAQSSAPQPKWVAFDIGPTGRMIAPYGDLDFEDAVAVFAKSVKLAVKYGAQLLFIQTMNDSYETKAALLAAKENSNLPVFVCNAYGQDGKLMTGADAAAMTAMLEGMGADAIGANCSLGPQALSYVVQSYLECASVPVIVKPNAGLPQMVDEKTVYDVTAQEFASVMASFCEKGVRIAGGCCGTDATYIAVLHEKTKTLVPAPILPKHRTCVSSYTHAVCFGEHPILIGERINPTGKKRLRQALLDADMDYLLQEGIAQQEHGAHLLDVNVGLPEIDEPTVLCNAVQALQAVTNLPLQIDTADPVAMERALRRYNGKAMLNSVNGKQQSMQAVFPLVKKYGGVVVALTLDENGIPATAQGRVEIAKRILQTAQQYGIAKEDIVFDPLALTVSADTKAPAQTLQAVKAIRQQLGCHTSLGVSNVSFGLPSRETIHSTFFAMALQNGLSAAILNPHSIEMQKVYHAFCALNGQDENCAEYIAFAASLPQTVSMQENVPATEAKPQQASQLKTAILQGRKEQAGVLAEQLLQSVAPLTVIEAEIVPALNTVGVAFEQKKLYLPQLLMSAEAAKEAFAKVEQRLPAVTANRASVVLATVQGDIHDIGKNIVKLILQNYGFSVVDLGKDVPPEVIVAEVKRLHAPLVGLSALMTTTVPAMEQTIALLKEHAPWCCCMVGGAVLTAEYAQKMGAHGYAKDAMEAVRVAKSLT